MHLHREESIELPLAAFIELLCQESMTLSGKLTMSCSAWVGEDVACEQGAWGGLVSLLIDS